MPVPVFCASFGNLFWQRVYQTERDLYDNPVTCAIDLLTDLLHFLHSQNQAIDQAR
ncbi:MAG: hypothetical protein ACNA8L_06080 [Luteolibacter sp.]